MAFYAAFSCQDFGARLRNQPEGKIPAPDTDTSEDQKDNDQVDVGHRDKHLMGRASFGGFLLIPGDVPNIGYPFKHLCPVWGSLQGLGEIGTC